MCCLNGVINMEKGQVASSFFIAAVIVFCIPMFVRGEVFGIIAKVLAGIIMAVGIIWLIYTIVFDKSGMNKLVNVLRTSFTSNAQPTQYNADKS